MEGAPWEAEGGAEAGCEFDGGLGLISAVRKSDGGGSNAISGGSTREAWRRWRDMVAALALEREKQQQEEAKQQQQLPLRNK